jgi:hypothetical protein
MELPSQQDFWNFYNGNVNELSSLYAQLRDSNNSFAIASNYPGAQQNDQARKNRIVQLIDELTSYHNKLTSTIGAIQREHISISTAIKKEKEKLDVIQREMGEKRELADLRKEQASDVRYKNDANYHSSVLGLWRPLHPNTRGVLYTVSTMLILISIAALAFLIMTNKNGIFPAKMAASTITSGSGTQPPSSLFNNNNYGRVAGGGMKLRPKK